MNAGLQTRTSCSVCRATIAFWPQHRWVQSCDRCLRPLAMLRVRSTPFPAYRLVSLIAIAPVISALAALVVLLGLATRLLPLESVVDGSVEAFTLQGCADLADGLLGLRSGFMVSWSRHKSGRPARHQALVKCGIGVVLLALAIAGLAST